MDFYRLVVEEHIKEVLDAFKIGKLTHEKAIEKINKASKYLYHNERYRQSKEGEDNSTDNKDNES